MVVVDSGTWLFPDRWSAKIVLTFTGQLESLYLHFRGAVIKLQYRANHLISEIFSRAASPEKRREQGHHARGPSGN